MSEINSVLQVVLQLGALGLLVLLGFGAFRIAVVYAPMVKDFLSGLIATQNAILQQNSAINVKLDELKGAVTKLECGVEKEVERARDDVLAALGSRPGGARPSSPALGRLSRP
jgi:hypothetical protein